MARRQNSTESTVEATEATPTEAPANPENTEAPANPENTEAPAKAENTEAPAKAEKVEAPAKAEKVEVVIDLTAFKVAASTAVENADSATGTVPEAFLAPVQAAYAELQGVKAKNAAKAYLAEQMKSSMMTGGNEGVAAARAYVGIQDSLSVKLPKAPKEPKAPADPTAGFVAKVAASQLGYALITSEVPEGVSGEWSEQVPAAIAQAQTEITAFKAWEANEAADKGDAPEVGFVAKTALRIAGSKAPGRPVGSTSSFEGPRRSVGSHIESAFADVESGTFLTVAEIRAHKSAEYGDESPSAGAISARLFPKTGKVTLETVTPGQNSEGVRGATKN